MSAHVLMADYCFMRAMIRTLFTAAIDYKTYMPVFYIHMSRRFAVYVYAMPPRYYARRY